MFSVCSVVWLLKLRTTENTQNTFSHTAIAPGPEIESLSDLRDLWVRSPNFYDVIQERAINLLEPVWRSFRNYNDIALL